MLEKIVDEFGAQMALMLNLDDIRITCLKQQRQEPTGVMNN